jgi:hypothetical protein
MRMVGSQRPLARIQRDAVETFRLSVLAAIMEQIGEVVHSRQSVDVLGPKHSLALGQARPKELFGGGIVSLLLKRQSLFLQDLRVQRSRRRRSGCWRSLLRDDDNDQGRQNNPEDYKTERPQPPR